MPSHGASPARVSGQPKEHPADGRVQAALRLRAENRLEEALELVATPSDYAQDVYTLRGDLQQELGLFYEAVGSYSTVIALDSQNTYARQSLAACLRKLGRWSAAAETLRKILEGDSYSDGARIALAECLLQMNKYEDALACFEACWSEAARVPALFGKAVALQMLRRFDESESQYLRFLEIHPEPAEALGNLIALSMEVFDLARVERYANELLEHDAQSIGALQALTLVFFERGAHQQAAEYYRRLLKITPEEKLMSRGNGDVLEYRLSPKSRDLLAHALSAHYAHPDLSKSARSKGH
jgi:tetratricopeptide (TPR) repeat protein